MAVRLGVVGSTVGARFGGGAADAPLAPDAPSTDPIAPWAAGGPAGAALARALDGFSPDTTGTDSLAGGPPERVNPWRVATVGGVTGVGAFAVLDYQRQQWWDTRSDRFRIVNDWDYARWADKVGHVYSSSFFTRSFRTALRWSGLPPRQARVWGAGIAWANMFYYEVLDGFGPTWGFSMGDLAANTVGVAFTTMQDAYPAANAVFLKASYWPSGREGKNFSDDYEGQTMWLTANPHRLVPTARRFLPPWLNVAVAYGARRSEGPNAEGALDQSALYLGLDFEPTGLPLKGPFWNTVLPLLRHVHFPAPALRLTPDAAFLPFAF